MYSWLQVEEQLSTPLLFVLKAHRFPLIFFHFPFVVASTVTSFQCYLCWAARENNATSSLEFHNGYSSLHNAENSVTVLKKKKKASDLCQDDNLALRWFLGTGTSLGLILIHACVPHVQQQQRSPLSSVYSEQNNKLPLLSGSSPPLRCLCFPAPPLPPPPSAKLCPSFPPPSISDIIFVGEPCCALIKLSWFQCIYISIPISKSTVGLIPGL